MAGAVFSLVLLLGISSGLTHDSHMAHLINVTVYYETLCPDSVKFMTTQLHPALEKYELAERLNLTLVPYGKTTYDPNQDKFTCHHGEKECEGNRLHACALSIIQGGSNTDKLGFNSGAVNFIDCLMNKFDIKQNSSGFPIKECSGKIPSRVIDESKIDSCKGNSIGDSSLRRMGNLTDAFEKPLKTVPTIVFNKNKEDSDLAKTDFVKALCKYIDHDKPADCSAASTPAAFIGTVALSLFFLLSTKIY